MHDVHRDSLVQNRKRKDKSRRSADRRHAHDDHGHDHPNADHDRNDELHGHSHADHAHDHHDHDHSHDHADGNHVHTPEEHDHDHPHDHGHDHDDRAHGLHPHGHDHEHAEEAYHDHDHDRHEHAHDQQVFGGRDLGAQAFVHLHEHRHAFYHQHHHTHNPEEDGLTHKFFRDPVRDWFGAALMALLIVTGYFGWLPGALSGGVLLCAAIIGMFPVAKNALFESLARRTVTLELLISAGLLCVLFSGRFLAVACIALCMLLGSFMRLNFSWRHE